jgi:hypothetical protein
VLHQRRHIGLHDTGVRQAGIGELVHQDLHGGRSAGVSGQCTRGQGPAGWGQQAPCFACCATSPQSNLRISQPTGHSSAQTPAHCPAPGRAILILQCQPRCGGFC